MELKYVKCLPPHSRHSLPLTLESHRAFLLFFGADYGVGTHIIDYEKEVQKNIKMSLPLGGPLSAFSNLGVFLFTAVCHNLNFTHF